MVDLKKKPFCLNENELKWVENTLKGMSQEEKIKQIFIDMINTSDPVVIEKITKERQFGGARYGNRPAKMLQDQNNALQKNSKIPLIIACNAESGGNGAAAGGTEVGCGIKIGATGNLKNAYELGHISGLEASSIGCNMTFAPVVDINMNFHNPIISSRSFGTSAELVRDCSLEYLRGAHDAGIACTAKHFPGDGLDERDQHLSYSVNTLSCDEWDKTFGMVYQSLIDAGIEAIMVGHIMLPSYQKYFNPHMTDYDILPATISHEILTNLLRDKLGFNGVVITDASHMVGFTGVKKRSELLPMAINAGCDMLLFYNDYEEDIKYVKDAVEAGIVTEERLNEAVTRILGLKAHLGLNQKCLIKTEEDLKNFGCEEYKDVAKQISHEAITLVKNNQPNVFPIIPSRYKRILLVPQESTNLLSKFGSMMNKQKNYVEVFKELLEHEGFEVEIFESLEKKLEGASHDDLFRIMNNLYGQKTSIASIKEKYDLVIHLANVGGNGTVQRLNWAFTKGSLDVPWYSHELPVIFISLSCPFHLFDVPEVQTYINAYDKQSHTLEAVVDKLVGREEFTGVSSVDAFCGRVELKL